jgi:iron complex outermembrane receptor protein
MGAAVKSRFFKRTERALGAFILSAPMIALPIAGVAQAQHAHAVASAQPSPSAPRPYDIPAGEIGPALTRWAQASGLRLLASSKALRGVKTQGASGPYLAEGALQQLLKGTTLVYQFTGERTVAIVDRSAMNANAQSLDLETITVEGQNANSNSTMQLAAPYAGGQVATGGQVGLLGNRNVMDTPFNQTSYTSETIRDQQARTIADVVVNDPSVRASWPATGYSAPLMIRGFAASNQDVSFGGLYGIAPAFTVNAGMAERVEVLKGPAALLSGMQPNGSVGGSVNIVPKRAGDKPNTELTANYASNSQLGGQVDVGRRFGPNNEFGARFNGSYQDGDTNVDHQAKAFGSGVIGLDYRGERLRLSADLGYQHQDFKAPTLITFVGVGVPVPKAPDTSSNWFFPWSWADIKDTFGATRAEFDLTPDWTLYAAAGGKVTDWERLSYFPTVTNAAGDLTGTPAHLKYRYLTDTEEVGVRGHVDTGAVNHQLTVSANRYHQRTSGLTVNAGGAVASNLYNPASVAEPGISDIDPPKISDSVLTSLAVGDVLSVFDKRIQFIVGTRQQNIEIGNFSATTGTMTSQYDKSALTPAVGLVVKPWRNVSIYGNYIEGLQQGAIVGGTYANAGQVLEPYVSKQHEVGVKVDWGGLTTTLAAFQISQPSATAPSATGVLSVDGEQRNRGLELNVFGKVSEDVRLLGGLSLIEATLTKTANGINDGNEAPGVPKLQINLGAEWDTPFMRGLTVTGRVIHTSEQKVDNANTQSIPSWTRLDVGARYKFKAGGKPIILRANIENVFDTDYWASAAYYPGWLASGAPRTFLLSTTLTF